MMSLQQTVRVGAAAGLLLAALHAAAAVRPETAVLPRTEYRVPLEEIIVQGPYWRRAKPGAAQQPRLQLPDQDNSRLRFAPRYTREEREDYQQVHERLNPQPRVKLFELKF